jgi:hypothetical protein
MAKYSQTELGSIAHKMLNEWHRHQQVYTPDDSERDYFDELVKRGIAIKINSFDYAPAMEYR